MTTTDPPQTSVVQGYLSPVRRPDFRWLVVGQMLSTFGNMMFTVALPFIVLDRGDAGDLSLTLAVLGVARILGAPVGGLLSDRWRPGRVMLSADLARTVVLVGLIYIGLPAGAGLAPLIVVIAVLGVLDGVFVPAYWAMMPSVLPEKELAAGNAIGESLMIVAVMLGPLAGGLAMASLPVAVVIGANAATFAVSALTLLKVRGLAGPAGAQRQRDPAEFRRFARGSRLFAAMLVMTGVLHLTSAGIVSVALPVFADREFADGAWAFGFLLSAQGAGLLAGTIAGGLLGRGTYRRGYLAVGLLVLHGLALAVFPYLPGLVPLMALMALVGLAGGVLTIVVLTLLQQISPDRIRGRVMAAFTSVTIGSYPVSVVLIGLIVTGSGTGAAFAVGAAGAIAVALMGISQRSVREA